MQLTGCPVTFCTDRQIYESQSDLSAWCLIRQPDLDHYTYTHFLFLLLFSELARVIEEKYLSYVANSCEETSNWRRLGESDTCACL